MSTKSSPFPTTRWTLLLAAGNDQGRREAQEWLCERYWTPIYVFLRRRGHAPAEAQDLTQGFLTEFLQRRSVEGADPRRGRFRSYLLGALKNFLSDRKEHSMAAKRGGGTEFLPLSFDLVEERYLECPASLTPEALYERQWALSLIDRVLELLRAEQESAGKSAVFDRLKAFMTGEGHYGRTAASLGMSEGAARVAVHRLRRRYRELLMAEITETVADPADVQQEIRHLIQTVSR